MYHNFLDFFLNGRLALGTWQFIKVTKNNKLEGSVNKSFYEGFPNSA